MSMLRRSCILITIFICLLSRAEAEPDPNSSSFSVSGNHGRGSKLGDAFDCDTSSSKAQRVRCLQTATKCLLPGMNLKLNVCMISGTRFSSIP